MKKNFMRLGSGIASFCKLNGRLLSVILMTALCAAVFTSCEKDDVPNYTISFDSKGRTPTPQQQTVKEGGKVAKPADPTRDNYTFGGWSMADNETGALWNFETETVTANITLFARWALISHPVTFDSDGGSAVTPQNVTHGSSAAKPADPTRNGYAFDGWFNNDTEWNFSTVITAPVTLKAKWTVVHAVTFDSDGGSAVSSQTIRDGSTATRPADPTKSIESGLYLDTLTNNYNYVFEGWYNGETLWNFDNDAVTASITLKARWSSAGNLTRIESVLPNDVAASVTYVNAHSNGGEEYTLLIGASNVSVGTQTLNAANAKLTIIGLGEERTITATAARLFTINGNNVTNLTLGRNITITGSYLTVVSNAFLYVQRGSLTMLDDAKIIGSRNGAVIVDGLNSVFKMECGEINGNSTGVTVQNSAIFELSGGIITGYTSSGNSSGDIYINYNCTFRLSGSTRIGTLILSANNESPRIPNNAITHSSITINSNFSGTVTRLNLYGSYNSASTIATWWTNVPVIVNATASIISMFNNGLGDFRGTLSASATISATHVLNASGILVLREN